MSTLKDALQSALAAAGVSWTPNKEAPAPKDAGNAKEVMVRGSDGEQRAVKVSYGASHGHPPGLQRAQRKAMPEARHGVVTPPSLNPPKRVARALSSRMEPSPNAKPVSTAKAEPAMSKVCISPSARCLVQHYPSKARKAKDYGAALGSKTQVAASKAHDTHDVVIGLDFGTSTVKVVVTDASLEQSFAVPLCDTDAFDAYLLPSRLFESVVGPSQALDGVTYSLIRGETSHRDLKLGLLGHPESTERQTHVTAFLSLVLRNVRAWLFKHQGAVYRKAHIAWRVTIGLPSVSVLNNDMVPLLERIVCAAWAVSCEPAAVTSLRVEQALSRNLKQEDLDLEVQVLPEITAQIYGFVASSRFDRKAANRFVLVDVGAGTVDSALFRVLPPKQGVWSFEFFTAAVQPYGVANLHAHRVDWWTSVMSDEPHSEHLLSELHQTKFATDMEQPLPESYEDYFEGVTLTTVPESPDREFFMKKVVAQVRGKTMWRAWHEELLPKEALTGVPIFVCGGGSRLPFYAAINEELARMPGCTWLKAVPWNLGFPRDLICESTDEAHFDRLSVAYGLSRLNLGSVVQASAMPKLEMPQQSWSDRYVDKDVC